MGAPRLSTFFEGGLALARIVIEVRDGRAQELQPGKLWGCGTSVWKRRSTSKRIALFAEGGFVIFGIDPLIGEHVA
jgi:hypothetical protein